MPAAAIQTPYVEEAAERKGARLFRKQVLPIGKVDHPKGEQDFTRARLEKIVTAFRAGAYDMVPLTFNIEGNKHSDDPERVRGEVEGLELGDDGLYALIKTNDRAAELVREHPKFPVSVRLCDPENGGFDEALAHVAATADPVIKGMKPWEAIEASRDTEVLDLSEGSFDLSGGSRSNQSISKDADTRDKDVLSDEEKGAVSKWLQRLVGSAKPADADAQADADADKDKSGDDDKDGLTPEQVQAAVAELIDDATGDDDSADDDKNTADDKEVVAASLSDEDRKKLDLANERGEKAELRAGRLELATRFQKYIDDGVPPSMVEAARDLISADDSVVMDFANDREPDVAKKVFAALEKAEGTIDFSERGSLEAPADEDEDKAKERREAAEAATKGWVGAGGGS